MVLGKVSWKTEGYRERFSVSHTSLPSPQGAHWLHMFSDVLLVRVPRKWPIKQIHRKVQMMKPSILPILGTSTLRDAGLLSKINNLINFGNPGRREISRCANLLKEAWLTAGPFYNHALQLLFTEISQPSLQPSSSELFMWRLAVSLLKQFLKICHSALVCLLFKSFSH